MTEFVVFAKTQSGPSDVIGVTADDLSWNDTLLAEPVLEFLLGEDQDVVAQFRKSEIIGWRQGS